MTTPTPTLSTFPLFPYLPTELRLKIYTHISSLLPYPRILQISPSPESPSVFISHTPPSILLSICHESRVFVLRQYSYLSLNSPPPTHGHSQLQHKNLVLGASSIPINYKNDILYISPLTPLLLSPSLTSSFLYTISCSPFRHRITHLALDLRIFTHLSENGFLPILAGMKSLRCLNLVVEFGRKEFEGEVRFVGVPVWRGDLVELGMRAERRVEEERERVMGEKKGEEGKGGEVVVRCVLLMRGRELA